MNIQKSSFSFIGDEKAVINVNIWTPESAEIKGVVVIVHGMAEYGNRYDRFARFLCSDGYVVYAHDHRGHGFSLNDRKIGFFAKKDGWELILGDLHKLVKLVKSKHPNLPITMFGHSMGSLLARTYAIDYGKFIEKLVLSGTAYDKGLLTNVGIVLAKTLSILVRPQTPSYLLTFMTFAGANKTYKNRRTKFDFLSRDEAEVDKYAKDELCGFVCSNSFFVDILTGLKYIHKTENVSQTPKTLPILIISGEDDPVGEYGKCVKKVFEQLQKSGCTNVSLKLYPEARHELVNEINYIEVYNDVLRWLNNN
jgi:alpha-beta hydrolase superfamily lysophospholipase